MGHKTHPYGFRLGIIKDWKTHWYANNASAYRKLVLEDIKLRQTINQEYQGFTDAGIARIEVDRGAQDTVINIHSARPGILIGRDGERVKNLRTRLEAITQHRIQLNIMEIEQPELNPFLVGRNIAEQLQRRVAYRRAIRQAAQRAMQAILRQTINQEYQGFTDAGIARIEVDRGAQDTVINIHSARPGILIGRDGERVKNLRTRLEAITQHRIQLNIMEIEQPELNPFLVGRNIADRDAGAQIPLGTANPGAQNPPEEETQYAGGAGQKKALGAQGFRSRNLCLGR